MSKESETSEISLEKIIILKKISAILIANLCNGGVIVRIGKSISVERNGILLFEAKEKPDDTG